MGADDCGLRQVPLQVRDRPRGRRRGDRLLSPEEHKTGAGCLYINKLDDVDEAVLAELIRNGYRHVTTVLHHA